MHLFPPNISVNIWSPTTAIFDGSSFNILWTFKKPFLNGFFAKFIYEICNLLAEALGIEIDDDANVNGKGDRLISTPNSKVKVYVIPTNEELVIARDTKRLLNL